MRLQNKVVIVAGAAWGGIGAATALRCAQEGAKVVVNTRGRKEKLQETVDRIEAIGGEAVAVMGDVAEPASWEAMTRAALDNFGKITTLVHNASSTTVKPVIEITQEEWNYGLAATLGGPWLGTKYCIPEMIKAGGGSIVYVSTVNATITNPGFGLYGAAKGGLNALARSVAVDYGRQGIRCNAVAPGQITGERHLVGLQNDPLEDYLSKDCYPVGRYGYPEEVANCILFLASDEASFVTGITMTVDGGLTLQSPEALVRPSFRKRWRENTLVPDDWQKDEE